MSDANVLLGLGTGRCGTHSLSTFIHNQPNAYFYHERRIDSKGKVPLLWHSDYDNVRNWITELTKMHSDKSVVGDVGMYYAPYLDKLLEDFPEAKFIWMWREKEQVVSSFMKKTSRWNHWQDHDGTKWKHNQIWDPVFPTYPSDLTKAEALATYWEDYKLLQDKYAQEYSDRFMFIHLTEINSEERRNAILDFAGYQGERVTEATVHTNSKEPHVSTRKKMELKFWEMKRKIIPRRDR